MLFLVGVGLEEGDISSRAAIALKGCSEIMLDRYTSVISDSYISFLEGISGKPIQMLKRQDLEENVSKTVGRAKESDIAILVPGDPLVATTHHLIIDTAHSMGVKCRVMHSSSIFSAAIGESCLDIYKFGPTTTIPFWYENYKPTSFADVILKNLSNGEHTLVLVDIDPSKGKTMGLEEALSLLGKAWSKTTEKDFANENIMALGNVGKEGQKIYYGTASEIAAAAKEFEGMAISIIVPASLSFAEEESLKKFEMHK
ncbi:MAG: diphthine synthase [Candidatus Micrarchaeia archaeon]